MKERRKSVRVRMDFMITYSKEKDPTAYHALGVNMSQSGLVMKSKESLKEGEKLLLKILVPGRKNFISFHAKVLYCLGALWEEEPPYRIGLQFVAINAEMKHAVAQFVEDAIKHQDWRQWF